MNGRKILISRSYIMLKSGSLEFFVGREYFKMLKAANRGGGENER